MDVQKLPQSARDASGSGWRSAALAHPGQHLGLKISISDEEIAYEILLPAELLYV